MINLKIDKSVFNKKYLPFIEGKINKRIQILYGGASSGKSVAISQRKILQHLTEPGEILPRKTLLVRKVQNTIKHSLFAELQNTIKMWDLDEIFKINRSDLTITRKDNRTSFISAGLEDVKRLKSIQGVTDIWVEEATELTKEDLLQLNLRLRGKRDLRKEIILSFNPISALHWLKGLYFDNPKEDLVYILKTTYLDNKFLDNEDRQQIELLKAQDSVYYDIYGLGNWGILGNLIYNNYVIEDFDRTVFNEQQKRYGLDWGFNDPSVFLELAYKDKEIYILNGVYAKRLTNSEFMDECSAWKGSIGKLTADSSEPDRIAEWNKNGWYVLPAKKEKGSVKFGIDFIKRHKIHIHKSMQDFINEIRTYSYRKDRDGNVLDEPIDLNNHYMDSMRYALEPDIYATKIAVVEEEQPQPQTRYSSAWSRMR